MGSAKTQPARGMRDFLPEDVRKREYVIGVIKEVYERYGFEPLETPAVENIETLLGKYGEEGNQLIYKILKRGVHEATGEADLALRYDLTVPLARVVAEYRDKLPKFFKRYQIQPVWRADRPARGRFREFYQCDVDIMGSRSMVVEAELCSAVSDVLVKLGFNDFVIRLNHRQVLTSLLQAVGIPNEQHADALVALDKFDRIGREGVAKEFVDRGIVSSNGEALLGFFADLHRLDNAADIIAEQRDQPKSTTYNQAVLGRLVEFIADDAGGKALDELREIMEYAAVLGQGNRLKLDPSLARGLSYYTGSIFEVVVPDLAGSLGGGGRYDELIGMFAGKKDEIPACGFSLGLERILVVMSEREMFPSRVGAAPADVMVLIWKEKEPDKKEMAAKQSLSLARSFRSQGLRVDVYPARNVGRGDQLAYAEKRGIPYAAFIGEDERAADEVTIMELRTREKRRIPLAIAGATLKQALASGGLDR
jgi:histidyl-tRNA synthetase